ncbi:hypothetical protein [Pseudomonas brassicacearum]|uniref:Uncharacterized protein n=1 Tax=Pseudomonas brassicacearum TaxID=930166 RepID=A0A423J7L9_9PSED|nr:hypothetical protein [Pseudomonas brassicacearum]RON33679.1 hypothetical protein BK664_24580 [Pseudomonas brassicacearum]
MRLTIEQIENANLAWVHDVSVQEGELKDPGTTKFYKLIVAKRPESVKASRVEETILRVVLAEVDDNVLEEIRKKLLSNSSLSESYKAIREGTWYKSTVTLSPA